MPTTQVITIPRTQPWKGKGYRSYQTPPKEKDPTVRDLDMARNVMNIWSFQQRSFRTPLGLFTPPETIHSPQYIHLPSPSALLTYLKTSVKAWPLLEMPSPSLKHQGVLGDRMQSGRISGSTDRWANLWMGWWMDLWEPRSVMVNLLQFSMIQSAATTQVL